MPATWTERLAAAAMLLTLAGCGADPPVLISLSPLSGSARGGDEVALFGHGFAEGAQVRFDGVAAEVLSVSGTELRVLTPGGIAGAVDVEVMHESAGSARLTAGFAYLALDLAFAEAPPHYLPSLDGLDVVGAAAADFDLDGDQDVVVGVRGGDSRLLLNTGLGQFVDSIEGEVPGETALQIRPWHSDTRSMVAADFDRDGDVDVFACNGGAEVDQLFVDVDGVRFSDAWPGRAVPDGDDCVLAEPLDIDGDGWTDLAVIGVAGGAAAPYYLRLYLNRGSRGELSFDVASDLEPPGDVEGEPVGAVDVDADGLVGSYTVTLEHAASGHGSGRAAYDLSAVAGMIVFDHAVAGTDETPRRVVAQLYGDGSGLGLSLVVEDAAGRRFAADLGAVDWTGWQPIEAPDPATWSPLSGEDGLELPLTRVGVALSGVASPSAIGEVFIDELLVELEDRGHLLVEGFERPEHQLAWEDPISSLASADVDGDGDLDLVLAATSSAEGRYLRLLSNRTGDDASAATAEAELVLTGWASPVLPALPDPVIHVLCFDADVDGAPDLLAVVDGDQDRLLLNDGNGHFFDDSTAALPVDWSAGRHGIAADLDLDGLPDLVIANHGGADRLYRNDGTGGFVDHTPDLSLQARDTRRLLALDADGDGDLDLLGFGDGVVLHVSVDDGGGR